jgi:hypothetical protein
VDLVVADEWKKTFVFVLDFRVVAQFFFEHAAFYHAIVAATFRHLCWLVPNYVTQLRAFQALFDAVPSFSSAPQLPKALLCDQATRAISLALTDIAGKLSALWNNAEALLEWVQAVIAFHVEIAHAFGFSKNLFIFEHFDLTDVEISSGTTPFVDSTIAFSLADMVKHVMNRSNFVVACHDEERFYGLLPALAAGLGSDFEYRVRFVNLVGLLSEAENSDKQFVLELVDEPLPLAFTVEMCGGIPAYLQIWDELNAAWEMIENGDADPDDEELLLTERFQQLARILFVQSAENDYQFEIKHCRRTARTTKSK